MDTGEPKNRQEVLPFITPQKSTPVFVIRVLKVMVTEVMLSNYWGLRMVIMGIKRLNTRLFG